MTIEEAKAQWVGRRVRIWSPPEYNADNQRHYYNGKVVNMTGPTVENGCMWVLCDDGIGRIVSNHQVEPL